MIYIIKCAYCGKTYSVNTDEETDSFLCESCGGANGLESVQEKFLSRAAVIAANTKKRTLDEILEDEGSLDTIKSFDMSEHPVEESYEAYEYGPESSYGTPESVKIATWIGIAAVILLIAICALADYNTKQQWEREEQERQEQMEDAWMPFRMNGIY